MQKASAASLGVRLKLLMEADNDRRIATTRAYLVVSYMLSGTASLLD
jgi:hypothetical protein